MWLRAACTLEFDVGVDTPFLLMIRPRSGWQQWVGSERYILTPSVPVVEFPDSFGNLCQRVVAPPGRFRVHCEAEVEAAEGCDAAPGAPFVEVQQLPEATIPFLLPSRYCESDRFYQIASSITSGALPGYDQCVAIVNHIRQRLAYVPGASGDAVSASEVYNRSQAVCRDMAHLGIALTRALSIPARMVVGYLERLQPMDLHAWFEAYVGGRWYTFDATQHDLQGGRIAIAYGRDAADVAIATQFGNPVPLVSMLVNVERMSQPPS